MNSALDTIRNLNFAEWLSLGTLFDTTPTHEWRLASVYAGLTLFFFAAGLVIPFIRMRSELKRRMLNLAWTNALLGIMLYFARTQELPILGMDVWRTAQEISLLFWINSIVLYARTGYKKEIAKEKAAERFNKYLPKAK